MINLKIFKQERLLRHSRITASRNKSKKEAMKHVKKFDQTFSFIFAKHLIQIQKNIQQI